ncbi:chromate resistance protein, partial [bacterium]|nr:chromate resistance protein [bacterium]
MIITHVNPDFDCVVATWLLKRFCGMDDEEIRFLKFNETVTTIPEDVIFVDIGKRDFDHHHRKDFVSAATLILEKFNLNNNTVLKQLADIARRIDHGLSDKKTEGLLNFINIISGLNKLYPHDPLKVMKISFECLDAIYERGSQLVYIKEEFQKGIKFCTKWGNGIGIETHIREIRGYCHRKGYIVFVYLDPVTQYRGFAAPGGKGVDFSDI